MNESDLIHAIANSWLGETMRTVGWLFPAFEALHFMGLCFLIGAMLIIDLRLLGFAKIIPFSAATRLIPVAIGAFLVNLSTGVAFICSDPEKYWYNPAFWAKMGIIVFAGLNALWFELAERRKLLLLADGASAGIEAKVAAGLSLLTWAAVIALGRFLPFVG